LTEEIAKLMKTLDITEEEAKELLEDDEKINKGQKMDFDLTPEQQKVAKKMKNAKRSVDAYGKKRTVVRKENPIKRAIISTIAEHLKEQGYENVVISNIEKIIDFEKDGNKFYLSLVQRREKE
jgi:uncharacterized membrane protein